MQVLKLINEQMDILSIPYEFGEWTQATQYPYFVGEITSGESMPNEDGMAETNFILTGFHRGKTIDLETVKEQVRKHFNPVSGLRMDTNSGAIIALYDGSFYIPSGEADLKKIQINIKILEWKGDI